MDRSVEPDPSVAKMERWRATVDQVFKAVFKQEIEVKLEGDNAIDVGGLVTIAYQRRTSEDAKSNAPPVRCVRRGDAPVVAQCTG
jgi:hypothetical protein